MTASDSATAYWYRKANGGGDPQSAFRLALRDGAVSPRMTVSASNGLKRPQPKDTKKPRRRWPSAADLE